MSLARKDWLEFVRDRRLLALAALAVLIALAALATSFVTVRAHEADRRAAQAEDLATWNGQGARNPHGAAHFGEWAMRPLTAAALLDPGVTPYAGDAVWLEAHQWNPARARPVEDQESSVDLGAFSVAWTLQVLVPLVIFILAAGLVARERERGTLRLLLANGAAAPRLLRGKAGSLALIAGLLAVPVLVAAGAAVLLAGGADVARLALWCGVHLIYLVVISAVALAVSAVSRTSAQALLILVGFWLLAVLVVPRAGAMLAEAASPAPSADAFWDDFRVASEREPQDDDAFTAATLRRYGVARKEDLPVSLAGLQLEEGERHGDRIFDRLYGRLNATYAAQHAWMRWAALLSPLPAVQNLSQGLAGTSMLDQVEFQRQGEAHRRRLISYLNSDMAMNAVGKDFDYRAGDALWRGAPHFAFQPWSLGDALGRVLPDAAILLAWIAFALLLVRLAVRELGREAT